jgi:hypothetical protein
MLSRNVLTVYSALIVGAAAQRGPARFVYAPLETPIILFIFNVVSTSCFLKLTPLECFHYR